MTDQHITAIATIVQDVLLLVSAGLIGWYLYETRKMRKAAERQVEATFRPAVVITHSGQTDRNPHIENIGNGPALEVRWRLVNSELTGTLPQLLPHQPTELPFGGVKPLYNAGLRVGPDTETATIDCSYRSLSGLPYSSRSTYNLGRFEFVTTFVD